MRVDGESVTIEIGASAGKAGKAIEKTSELLKKFSDSAKSATQQTSKFAKAVSSAGLKTAFSPLKKAAGNASDFTKKIDQLGAAFKRIVFYRTIRTVIKQIGDAFRVGTENLYYYSQGIGGQFARSMDMAATSMLYFKNSIGAAVAPIVNALAPVLDMLVDKIVAVINAINQLFARLTGATSWTRAIKYPKQYGDAMSGAGKKAKEAMRWLAPFDELNVLPSDNAGRGSGGGLSEDYSAMFEEMAEFNKEISDFSEKIRRAIENGRWDSVGKLLGEKVNGIVDSVNWSGAGSKIGEYINAWFTAKYWTLETINFRNIGSRIAEFLNSAISNINFFTIGRSFTRGFTALGDLAIGAIGSIKWSNVGKAVNNYLRGALDEASEWLAKYNWSIVGQNLYNGFMDLISGLDFGSFAKSFFTFLGKAAGASLSFFFGLLSGIYKDVEFYFQEKTREVGGNAWEGFKKGIKDAISGVFAWVKTNMVDPFVNAFKSILGIHSPSTVFEGFGQNIVQGLWNGIESMWSKFTGWFSEKWFALKRWWQGLELPSFRLKTPHLTWTTKPAGGWIANILSTLGLPTSLPKLNVQWYARGGIVDKASLIGAGEVGKEAIVPLERNTQWVDMVARQMSNRMNNNNGFGGDIADDLEDANGVVVNAIFAATEQIVRAMRENGGKSTNGNIASLAREVTRWQRNQAVAYGG